MIVLILTLVLEIQILSLVNKVKVLQVVANDPVHRKAANQKNITRKVNILKVKVVHQRNPLTIKNLVNNHKPIIVTTAQIPTTIIKDKHKTTNNLLLVSKVIN